MKRTHILIGVAVVFALGAFLLLRAQRPRPADGGRMVAMRCASCNATYELRGDDYDRLAEARGGDPRAAAEDPLALAIPCAQCGQRAALRDWQADRTRSAP